MVSLCHPSGKSAREKKRQVKKIGISLPVEMENLLMWLSFREHTCEMKTVSRTCPSGRQVIPIGERIWIELLPRTLATW
jgi:hypothetical protein